MSGDLAGLRSRLANFWLRMGLRFGFGSHGLLGLLSLFRPLGLFCFLCQGIEVADKGLFSPRLKARHHTWHWRHVSTSQNAVCHAFAEHKERHAVHIDLRERFCLSGIEHQGHMHNLKRKAIF